MSIRHAMGMKSDATEHLLFFKSIDEDLKSELNL